MRRLLLAALIAGLGVLLLPVPAQAGGPTSVMITNQALGRAAGLIYTDKRYGELEHLLTDDITPVEEPANGFYMDSLTVSWLVHDVEVWRTDRVVLDAPGGPLVATTITLDELPAGERKQTWARVDDGPALKSLMNQLGVTGKATPGATAGDPVDDPVADPVAGAVGGPSVETGAEATPWFALSGWRWAVPGLLAGLVVGLLALPMRRLASRRSPGPGPRHELIDRAPVGGAH